MSAIKPIGTAPDHNPNQEYTWGGEEQPEPEQEFTLSEGIQEGISNWDYHNDLRYNALSSTGIRTLLKSPAHFKIKIEPTKEMIFGSAAHSYLLEPESDEIVIIPEINRRTNEGKGEWIKFLEENFKKIIISADELEIIKSMRETLLNQYEYASMLLQKGTAELSAFWQHETYDFWCKCRPDFLVDDLNIIVDYKTCREADIENFGKESYNRGYHIQAAWYRDGIEQITGKSWDFVFIAQEKTEPYGVGVYKVPEKILAKGTEELAMATRIYDECLKTNKWRGYPDRIQQLEFPAWAFR